MQQQQQRPSGSLEMQRSLSSQRQGANATASSTPPQLPVQTNSALRTPPLHEQQPSVVSLGESQSQQQPQPPTPDSAAIATPRATLSFQIKSQRSSPPRRSLKRSATQMSESAPVLNDAAMHDDGDDDGELDLLTRVKRIKLMRQQRMAALIAAEPACTDEQASASSDKSATASQLLTVTSASGDQRHVSEVGRVSPAPSPPPSAASPPVGVVANVRHPSVRAASPAPLQPATVATSRATAAGNAQEMNTAAAAMLSSIWRLPLHQLFTPAELVSFSTENDRSKMQEYYMSYSERKGKEHAAQHTFAAASSAMGRQKMTPEQLIISQSYVPPSFSLRLQDECMILNFSSAFPPNQDRSIPPSTKFRGGSALEALLNRKVLALDRAPASSAPHMVNYAWECSLVISLYQHGMSLNPKESNFLPYDDNSLALLAAIDQGRIPPFLSALTSSSSSTLTSRLPLHFYDGCLLAEIRDYRMVHPPYESQAPQIKRLVLQPTPETLRSDVKQLMHSSHWEHLPHSDRLASLLENEILLHKTPPTALQLFPSPRVFQLLNFVYYNRQRALVSTPLNAAQAQERIHELHELMHESMFGLEYMDMKIGANGLPMAVNPSSASAAASRPSAHERLLRSSSTLSTKAREKLLALLDSSKSKSNAFVSAPAAPAPASMLAHPNSAEKSAASSTVAASLLPASSASFSTVLAYASFVQHTNAARYMAAANALLSDVATRAGILSGPIAQLNQAEAAYQKEVQNRKEILDAAEKSKVQADVRELQRVVPLTIMTPMPLLVQAERAEKALNNKAIKDMWTVQRFATSQQRMHPNDGRRVLTELHIHAIPAKPIPNPPATLLQGKPNLDLMTGYYEAYLRVSHVDSHELPPVSVSFPLGREQDKQLFLERYKQIAAQYERQEIGEAHISNRPTLQMNDELSFINDFEARPEAWARYEAQREAMRAQQQQQQQQQMQQRREEMQPRTQQYALTQQQQMQQQQQSPPMHFVHGGPGPGLLAQHSQQRRTTSGKTAGKSSQGRASQGSQRTL